MKTAGTKVGERQILMPEKQVIINGRTSETAGGMRE